MKESITQYYDEVLLEKGFRSLVHYFSLMKVKA
jgi:hypothetical protein